MHLQLIITHIGNMLIILVAAWQR